MKTDATTIHNMIQEIDFIVRSNVSGPVRQSAERLQFLIYGLKEPPTYFKDLVQSEYVKRMKEEGYCILKVKFDTHCKKCGLPIIAGTLRYPSYGLWKKDAGVLCPKECKANEG